MGFRDEIETLSDIAGAAKRKARHHRYMEKWYGGQEGCAGKAAEHRQAAEECETVTREAGKGLLRRLRGE